MRTADQRRTLRKPSGARCSRSAVPRARRWRSWWRCWRVALRGGRFGFEASSFFDAEGPAPGVGQLLLVADPDAFAGREAFLDRTASLTRMIEADAGARLPGTRRLALRAKAQREGLVVDAKLVAQARALAHA